MREFLHVDDMAEASLFVLDLDKPTYDANTELMLSHINVGTGADITILDLARMVARVTGSKAGSPPTPTQARRHDAQADGCQPPGGYGLARFHRP